MWLPSKMFDLFKISKESFDDLRMEVASTKVEKDLLKSQLASSVANSDWLRVKVNQLELERSSLLEKLYGMKVPVPEISRTTPIPDSLSSINNFSFDHIDDETAKKLGVSHLLS